MIELKNISKQYADEFGFSVNLIKDISAVCENGKLTAFLAQTGAGKTSLLKIISGLENPSGGEIKNSGEGRVAFLPSEPSSFPWLSAKSNLSVVCDDDAKIKKLIKFVGLEGYEDHFPHNKSRGFRFRISLARALAADPSAIAADEVFDLMDSETKKECYILLRETASEFNVPVIFASTNITEAVFVSDKIYLVKKDPAEIISEKNIKPAGMRDSRILESSEFASVRNEIESEFKSTDAQKLFNISI